MSQIKRCFATLLFCLAFLPLLIEGQPSTGFDTGSDGWFTVGDPGSGPTPVWHSTGGNPGGCYVSTDESIGTWYWLGSTSFKGNLSSYYGCYLVFDLKQNTNTWQFDASDVVIINTNDSTLVYNTSTNPGTTWTSYVVPLSTGGWRKTSLSGSVATASEVLDFLTNCKRIRIRAEYSGLTYETDYIDNVAINCSAIILPVELSEFTVADKGSNTCSVKWTTQSENNCAGFQVEKSPNGMAFDSIGYISGNGTTSLVNNYSFSDDAFYATSYYRLKQIDADGKATYSDIRVAEPVISYNNPSVSIYPNPASDIIHVTVEGQNAAFCELLITDMFGKKVFSKTVPSAMHLENIVIEDFPSGMYQVSIISANSTRTYPVEVIK